LLEMYLPMYFLHLKGKIKQDYLNEEIACQ